MLLQTIYKDIYKGIIMTFHFGINNYRYKIKSLNYYKFLPVE